MQSDSIASHTSSSSSKLPRPILKGIFAFAPNRSTLGGTSYFIVDKEGNIAIDCPPGNEAQREFMRERGGVRWLFITHRNGIGERVELLQQEFACEVVVQEQEAYLLPEVPVTTFTQEFNFNDRLRALWTPGFSPGSSCLYYSELGGVLFSGRHLLPTQTGAIAPLRVGKTFHWWRQLKSVELLRDRFTPETLQYICPGASTGFLRGRGFVSQAYEHLCQLNLDLLREKQLFM